MAGLGRAGCAGALGLPAGEPDLREWRAMVDRAKRPVGRVEIALVGKYVALHDAYLSVAEALTHGGIENGVQVDIRWVDSEELTDENAPERLDGCAGVLVPGGFGSRGVEGMISAVRWAREQKIPYFGICLGMQMAVVEFARHAAGLADAHSSELAATPHPVIDLMPDQRGVTDKGGTMRLGACPCHIAARDTRAYQAYGMEDISERHRHRYEFNNDFRALLTEKGLVLSGLSPDGRLVEMVELPDHPWFVGGPVPSGVQIPAQPGPPPVPGLCRRGEGLSGAVAVPRSSDLPRPANAGRGRSVWLAADSVAGRWGGGRGMPRPPSRSIPHDKAVHRRPRQVVDRQDGLAAGPQGALILPGVDIAVLPLGAHHGDQVGRVAHHIPGHRVP